MADEKDSENSKNKKEKQELRSHFTEGSYKASSPSHSSFGMSGAGGKLVQEIQDEFLVCKICLEVYKNPKSLNCLHTFCEVCIENHVASESTYKKYSDYREFTCPLCRKRTQLPIGGVKKLPDNFLVANLSEVISRSKPSKFPFCDICKMVNRKHREAASKCLDCAKLLCKSCVELHRSTKVTTNHSIFDIEIEKDIECKEHEDEVVRFYCEPCETCICVLCTFNEHKDHEITQFGEAVEKYKDNIQTMLTSCKSKIDDFDNQIESLNKVENIIKAAEQKIHDTAIQFIADIRNKEKSLVDELRNLYGKDLMEQVDNKKDMATSVEGLRSTCNLTEVILKGKDIELLLLKKDVQKKLSLLGDIDIKPLPETVNKAVLFLPGEFSLGVLFDEDRPILSRMKTKKFRAAGEQGPDDEEDEEQIEYCNSAAQTDLKHTEIKVKGDSDNESEDESESEESGSESESEDEKPEMKDSEVQTDKKGETSDEESDEEAEKPEMVDRSTETEEVSTEEKGVNTRSRSLQSLNSPNNRRSPNKDNKEDSDSSLAARRRRRRERANTTHIGSYNSVDIPDSNDSFDDTERRKPRQSRFLHNHSMDDDYYDSSRRRTTAY